MITAECQCGQIRVELAGPPIETVVCHCVACQRRSGSPFGMFAHYPVDRVSISGEANRYTRPTDEGGAFDTFFCPRCGSSVYARDGKISTLILIAVGAIADPGFPAPVRSVWEDTRHHWVRIPGDLRHYPRGRE